MDERQIALLVKILSSGEPRFIAQGSSILKRVVDTGGGYPLLVAPFIAARGRSLCRELGVGFADLAGNARIAWDGLLIDRWGRDNPRREERILRNLLGTKATWVIRILLDDPERRWTLSELSERSRVSIGMVHRVVRRLANEGFAEMQRGATGLVRPGELLDAWAEVYRHTDHTMVGYHCPLRDQESILDRLKELPEGGYALTMGAGAFMIAPFVRSDDVYMYIRDEAVPIIRALDLTPVEFGGNVSLLRPSDPGVFMGVQRIRGLSVVSNVQLYLDLYHYPARGREQADHVRDKMMGM